MGIFNRDYMRSQPARVGPADWSAVVILMVLNAAVFLVWQVPSAAPFLEANFATSLLALQRGRVWTLLTSAFSHQELLHLLFNMLFLFVLGRPLEEVYGKRRFLIFYCLAGMTASLFHCALDAFGWPSAPALGASGAVMAVVVVFAWTDPRRTMLLFGLLPIPMWTLAGVLVLFDVVQLVKIYGASYGTGIAHGAHVGGALFGVLYSWADDHRMLPALLTARSGRRRRRRRRVRPSIGAGPGAGMGVGMGRDPYSNRTAEEEARLDHLLRKVSTGGLDSLTPDEREFLLEMSKKTRRP